MWLTHRTQKKRRVTHAHALRLNASRGQRAYERLPVLVGFGSWVTRISHEDDVGVGVDLVQHAEVT